MANEQPDPELLDLPATGVDNLADTAAQAYAVWGGLSNAERAEVASSVSEFFERLDSNSAEWN